jgi:hypothetical protein
VQEEAEFWDTHDTSDFDWEEMDDDVEFILVKDQPKKGMTVRLEPDILTLLTREARDQGIGPSTLARMIILGYLKDSGRGTILRGATTKKRAPQRKRSKGAA